MRAQRSPLVFFLLLLALAVPLWLAGGRLGVIGALRIPVSDLALAFTPMAAALILAARAEGGGAAVALLARAFDPRSLGRGRWVAAALLTAPAICLSAWALMRLAGVDGAPLRPDLLRTLLLFVLFLVLAAGEEVGWMGYAYGPMRDRWGALRAALVLAVPWWLGHLPSMAAIGTTAADVAWWILGAAALRVLIAWLYEGTGGSLFAAVLFHALLNLGRILLYPAAGAHYSTAYQATGDVVAAALAAAVAARSRVWPGAARS
ncbi:CAAX amino terminal protease family protein [Cystobacter fuscus DSM 2262]|uniref:CAAX amino terminal protease family protein n=1 Tax=Cystobacter fuscus (strain ATCC 25194 / DSM 2262 / NBRC 100088 / M29) TaxID=1242864 RepID=S9PAI0_CYSF2|nr:CPBP family intramembrane glutamic endopeptidase [Cystobacter fuscus]EPX59272.1 CAAX amino terminal protease family protein [Cystobacter fuscus DSM 2262]